MSSTASELLVWQPKVIIFDLLTGLLDSWKVWDQSIPGTESHLATGTEWRKRYLAITYACTRYEPYEELVAQAAREVGLSQAPVENLLRDYDSIRAWPEVPSILRQLQDSGFRLGILTNISSELGRRTVSNLERQVSQETGGDFVFDVVVTAEEVGFYKPNPRTYEAALQAIGAEPNEALFVAGSSYDVDGASKVGMRVVWNNHVGLPQAGRTRALREGNTLTEAVSEFLP